MIEIDDEVFQKNLLLTQAYCELQLMNGNNNEGTALRTFNPIYNGKEIFSYERGKSFNGDFITVEWGVYPLEQNSTLYNDAFEQQMVDKNNSISFTHNNRSFEGRILIADIDRVIMDGISEYETQGFIDYYDCPPIDTWFYMGLDNQHRILFAWIPQTFVHFAQVGMDVNMLATFVWYEDWISSKVRSSIKFKHRGSRTSILKYINNLFGK